MNSMLFSSLPLAADMLKNLETLGYKEMTPIQAKSLPFILKNLDVIAKANTGSGKTAAFGIGLLSKLDPQAFGPQSIVICPTRELADQVSKEIRRLARFTPNIRVLTLCGGKPFRAQAESLSNGVHIIVGTPGRIQDHIEKKTLILKRIETLVLDEADRMLDMGFFDVIMDIIKILPSRQQTLLFSATYPREIESLKLIQKNPIEITLTSKDDSPDIAQIAYQVKDQEKNKALLAILANESAHSAIVFCKTKMQCDEVKVQLCDQGFFALAIHSDLEQREREEVLLQFANKSCSVLVATDVAARGLDIKDLPLVINYDLPSSPEMYIHRIGRTGRNGKSGMAVSIYTYSETFKIEAIEKYTQSNIKSIEIEALNKENKLIAKSMMRTLCINGGKKNKIRPKDILGALTGEGGLTGDQVGKIDIFDFCSYVAINRASSSQVLNNLKEGKIKGRIFKIRYLDNA